MVQHARISIFSFCKQDELTRDRCNLTPKPRLYADKAIFDRNSILILIISCCFFGSRREPPDRKLFGLMRSWRDQAIIKFIITRPSLFRSAISTVYFCREYWRVFARKIRVFHYLGVFFRQGKILRGSAADFCSLSLEALSCVLSPYFSAESRVSLNGFVFPL